jgi:hypothetical protein
VIDSEEVKKRCTAGRKPLLKVQFTKIVKDKIAENETNSTLKYNQQLPTAIVTIIV